MGEQPVLVTDKTDADKPRLPDMARRQGLPEPWVPMLVLVVATIPVLGSGKVDLRATSELMREMQLL